VVEVLCPQPGKIQKVLVKKGDQIKIGQPLVTLTSKEESPPPQKSDSTSLASSMVEEKPVMQKAPLPSSSAAAKEKDSSPPPLPTPAAAPTSAPEEIHISLHGGKDPASVPAGPVSRKLARELGVDITLVPGSGRRGRITPDDVKAYVKQQQIVPASSRGPAPLSPLPDFARWGKVETEPVTPLRRKISDNLQAAWSQVPLVTQFDEADITALEVMRKKNVEAVRNRGGHLTLTVFALKAIVHCLKEHPRFNASLDPDRGELILKKYFHIGVAVDTPVGLIVPVIKDVDQKHFLDLALELTEISEKARQRKVSLDELNGGNISLSNLGGIGGTGFTPVVRPPEVAVVGLSRGQLRPIYREGQFQPRLILPFGVSYDHRVIDGADAARFCRTMAEGLENHEELLITG
ncbi:MAG: 2-oxo acid dehydrogenase subunit E2, partial [Nitrospinaceae bacterium]